MKTRAELEAIAKAIVNTSIQVHRALGPGLLESTDQSCHAHDLRKRGLQVLSEAPIPVHYDELFLETGYRIDMFVENAIIIEHKAVQELLPIHTAQLLTYMKLSKCRIGFLLNGNVSLMKDGIHRLVNNL